MHYPVPTSHSLHTPPSSKSFSHYHQCLLLFRNVCIIHSRLWTTHCYLVLCASDAAKKDQVSDKETEAQVEVNAVPGALDGADQGESQDAEEEANQ
jgi:hypothetical protein